MIRLVFLYTFASLGTAALVLTAIIAPTAAEQTAGPAVVAGLLGALLCLGMAGAIGLGSGGK